MSAPRIKRELGGCPILDPLRDIVAEYATASDVDRTCQVFCQRHSRPIILRSEDGREHVFNITYESWRCLLITWDVPDGADQEGYDTCDSEMYDSLLWGGPTASLCAGIAGPCTFVVSIEEYLLALIDAAIVKVDLTNDT